MTIGCLFDLFDVANVCSGNFNGSEPACNLQNDDCIISQTLCSIAINTTQNILDLSPGKIVFFMFFIYFCSFNMFCYIRIITFFICPSKKYLCSGYIILDCCWLKSIRKQIVTICQQIFTTWRSHII